ncbi:unnamed protein product, partial [Ixodes hexagonus]
KASCSTIHWRTKSPWKSCNSIQTRDRSNNDRTARKLECDWCPGRRRAEGPPLLGVRPGSTPRKGPPEDSRRAHRRGLEGLSGRRPHSRARAPRRTPERTLESDARARGP